MWFNYLKQETIVWRTILNHFLLVVGFLYSSIVPVVNNQFVWITFRSKISRGRLYKRILSKIINNWKYYNLLLSKLNSFTFFWFIYSSIFKITLISAFVCVIFTEDSLASWPILCMNIPEEATDCQINYVCQER